LSDVSVLRLADGDTVVCLVGDLIGDAAAAMRQTLIDQLSRAPTRLIVDLSEVRRIDAGGIDSLVAAAALAGEADHAFCLVDGAASRVQAALAVEQLSELFEVFSSISEAVRDSG
jgi:anti-anti-sigma regulatory factor